MASGRAVVGIGLVFGALGGLAFTVVRHQAPVAQRLTTGKFITPQGSQTEVGSFPINMAVSPDGRYVVVTDAGFREQLSVLDAATGQLISLRDFPATASQNRALFYGLTFAPSSQGPILYASEGVEDAVAAFALGPDGTLRPLGRVADPAPPVYGRRRQQVAGLAASGDGQLLFAVHNQSNATNGFAGSVSVIDTVAKKVVKQIPTLAYPYAVASVTAGPNAGKKIYVTCERDGQVASLDLSTGQSTNIRVGDGPTSALLSGDQSRLFVTNSRSDTVSIIDTVADRVTDTILLREGDLRGLPGATPLGMALSPDEGNLFVALGDMNAVAVVDLRTKQLAGLIDVGWYPTSVAVTRAGKLFVSNAKGVQTRNPNDVPVRHWGQYAPNILEGTVSVLDVSQAMNGLADSTQRVLKNSFNRGRVVEAENRAFTKPRINHVIYVIKENRTYDQVFGDIAKGNGDSKICLFPREVTPNQHALADRFTLLDNFYVCAEVSYDGWAWSTAGIASPYVERSFNANYSRRGLSYDSEGTNNGSPVELLGMKDVAKMPNGFIWDQALRQHESVRDYGFFVSEDKDAKKASGAADSDDVDAPVDVSLVGKTCLDFPEFDTEFADSDAWKKYGLKPFPRQKTAFGRLKEPSRMTTFKREFDEFVKNGRLPSLVLVRLPRNHTAGTSAGQSSPRACVADNDYAVGELVDMVSHSPYWKDTAICVLEDDAQAGFDHVDCHRSPALVISAYNQRSKVDSRFYNTDSMLHTMELLLGLKPLSQYDASAPPIDIFSKRADNAEPYDAILPPKNIIAEFNTEEAYRSDDSARLIRTDREESHADVELNDILWGAIKGAKTPRPEMKGARWRAADLDD